MGVFERFLTVWVALGIAAGVVLGLMMPSAFEWVAAMEYAQVNLVVVSWSSLFGQSDRGFL